MKIYFIYNPRLDTLLDSGKGKFNSGYKTRNIAQSILDFQYKDGKYSYVPWLNNIPKEEWKIIEVEIK